MNNESHKYLVTKISMIDTMRGLPIGKPVTFDAKTCGSLGTARSAASRLQQSGEGRWLVTSEDNGMTYTILRKS